MTNTNLNQFAYKQKKYWDKKSESYHRLNRNHLKKIKKIIKILDLTNDQKILEIGVGTGIHANYLLSRYNIKFFGVDISKNMINKAKIKLNQFENVILQVTDAEHLNFSDDSFDAVFCTATLHHLKNPCFGLREMYRVVKGGGKLVIIEPNIFFPKNLFQALFIPAERNNLLLTKKNLIRWAKKLKIKKWRIHYFLYSLPFPKFLFNFYDFLDNFLQKIPLLRNFAVQICFVAEK